MTWGLQKMERKANGKKEYKLFFAVWILKVHYWNQMNSKFSIRKEFLARHLLQY